MKKPCRFIALFCLLPTLLWAHDPGLSSATGTLQGDRLILTVSFAMRDAAQLAPMDANGAGEVTRDEFTRVREHLAGIVATNCEVKADGSLLKPLTVTGQQADAKNADVRFEFSVPPAKQLEFSFPVIRSMPLGHRMFFSLADAKGKMLEQKLLAASSAPVIVMLNLDPGAPPEKTHTLLDFILMGVEHIGTGYDHLLFLFALLVVTRSFRSALAVITAFTIAHSITLAVATFNLVNISPNITEPMIAATIVYVGLENLVRHGDPHKRWRLTFAFGLIHGFGFASALREMGVGERTGGVVMPLFGFNLGVELGQLTVAAIVLPIVWKLRTKENFLRYGVPACSIAVALAGGFWFVQRVWFN